MNGNVLHLKRNYDTIAFFYDRLARLVYGNAFVNAQAYLVKFIPANARILIVGGGTGWILEEITNLHFSGLNITYVDASSKMIALAKRRNCGNNKIIFITQPIEAVTIDDVYDVVFTPFFFDNFSDNSLSKIFSLIDKHMKENGLWLFCDFQNTNVFWQSTLLRIMYFFFRASCGIEAKQLPDIEACFARYHYKSIGQRAFFKGFIISKIYERE